MHEPVKETILEQARIGANKRMIISNNLILLRHHLLYLSVFKGEMDKFNNYVSKENFFFFDLPL